MQKIINNYLINNNLLGENIDKKIKYSIYCCRPPCYLQLLYMIIKSQLKQSESFGSG